MTLLTEKQKQIYNLYLRAFRTNNNLPFRAKKKFSDIETDGEKLMSLQKIEKVFNKYPAFFNSMFFDAPYKIYDDQDGKSKWHSLKFYGSQKGITTCIAYYKTLMQSNPEEQFDFLKESYKFVTNFCIEKKITLDGYTRHCSVAQNDCLIHLKEHKISWYLVFDIPHFHDLLYRLPEDEFELYYGSDVDLTKMQAQYRSSQKTQDFLAGIRRKITPFIRQKISQQSVVKDK